MVNHTGNHCIIRVIHFDCTVHNNDTLGPMPACVLFHMNSLTLMNRPMHIRMQYMNEIF